MTLEFPNSEPESAIIGKSQCWGAVAEFEELWPIGLRVGLCGLWFQSTYWPQMFHSVLYYREIADRSPPYWILVSKTFRSLFNLTGHEKYTKDVLLFMVVPVFNEIPKFWFAKCLHGYLQMHNKVYSTEPTPTPAVSYLLFIRYLDIILAS